MKRCVVDSRSMVYSGEINDELALEFVSSMLTLNRQQGPVKVICTGSYGGDVEPGLAIIDCLKNCPNHVSFYCSGIQASAQALIPLAADEVFFTGKSAHFLFHKGSAEMNVDIQSDSDLKALTKTSDAMKFQNEWDCNWLAANSEKNASYWKKRLEKDSEIFIFSDEAIELGLIQGISQY